MTLFDPTPDAGDPARLRLESQRTCDRLRSLSLIRLDSAVADGRTRAGAAFALAQVLADAAAGLSGRSRHDLPELPSSAAGDVLAVCALDLADEVVDHPGEAADRACRDAVARLVDLRRAL